MVQDSQVPQQFALAVEKEVTKGGDVIKVKMLHLAKGKRVVGLSLAAGLCMHCRRCGQAPGRGRPAERLNRHSSQRGIHRGQSGAVGRKRGRLA